MDGLRRSFRDSYSLKKNASAGAPWGSIEGRKSPSYSSARGNRLTLAVITTMVITGLTLNGLVILTYYHFQKDLNAARARISAGSQVINTAYGPIEYAVAGQGPPVLIIHGAGGGFDQGLEFGGSLIDGGFQVISVSRFGYLRTPLPSDAAPEAQADAHAALLDALNLQRVAVFGGSAGAPSAMQLCLRHPERCTSMTLLVPLAFAPHPADGSRGPSLWKEFIIRNTLRSDFFFWTATKVARNTLIETILGTPMTDFENASPEERMRVLDTLRHILPISPRAKGLLNDGAIAAALPRYDLERFTVPTLVISTENDLYQTYRSGRYTAEHIPGARFVGYPNGGHLMVGRQKEGLSEITEFLKAYQ